MCLATKGLSYREGSIVKLNNEHCIQDASRVSSGTDIEQQLMLCVEDDSDCD